MIHDRSLLAAILVALLTAQLAACSSSSSSSAGSATSTSTSSPPAPADSVRPPTQAELPSTDGGIAAGNLAASIAGAEARLKARGENDAEALTSLYVLVSEQQRFSSSVAALRRMQELADRIVTAAPKDARSYVTRGGARAAVHRFAAAKEDIAAAVKLGATDYDLDNLRASIAQAEGELDRALELRHKMSELRPSIGNLGAEAVLLADLGRVDEAQRLFERAAREYRDVSAHAIAWLFFEEGAVWERARNLPRARAFYLAAYERLPMYAHAASHYALLEKSDAGLTILAAITATADDPEFDWALAQVLRRHHKDADADAHLEKARARYDALTAELPEAYAEHAANFWLADGGDATKALLWAKKNLEVRRSSAAYETALLAAIAAKSTADACIFRDAVDHLAHSPDMLRSIAKDACPSR